MKYLRYKTLSTSTLGLVAPRQTSNQRGYGAAWQKARLNYLMLNPLCVECSAEGRVVSANVVDHIIPHKGDETLFWDESNWQPLCRTHHSKKTAKQDGGFGNRTKK